MIVFLTLYLGLVSGRQPVALQADAGVKSIRILIDGAVAATLTQPPFRGEIDFGPELLPREVVAVALDSDGREIARASQFVNVPRPPAEIEIVVERNAEGRPLRAKLVARHLAQRRTTDATMKLDDAALRLDRDLATTLPAVDMTRPHVLAAEMRFADGATARHELVFGGQFAESAEAQLTPVAFLPASTAAPAADCVANGAPLRVRSVEEPEAEVIIVRDPDAAELKRQYIHGITPSWQPSGKLDAGMSAQLLSPVPNEVRDRAEMTELFPMSARFDSSQRDMLYLLTALNESTAGGKRRQWADAVAVAGVRAAARGRRRAVVLVLGRAPDRSDYQPATVRKYLAALGVPLFVWSPSGAGANWGSVEDVSSVGKMIAATEQVRRALREQRIAWIEADPLTALRARCH
jgi:hypothetical protein